MLPTNLGPLPEWNSDDAKALRDMLNSTVFLKALAHVQSECPELLDGQDVNMALVASGKVKGFSKALETLFRLTFEQPKVEPESESYPSLDDDSKWDPNTNEPVA